MGEVKVFELPLEVTGPSEIALAEHAEAIRLLGKRVIGDVLEIGRRLTEAKKLAGHGGWGSWLKREFGWTDKTAERFMSVHALTGKFDNLSNLELPVSGLYLLAALNTPDEAREAILDRAENGETFTLAQIQTAIAEARDTEREAGELALAKAHEQFAAKEAALRADLGNALTAEELKIALDEALAPYQEQIEKLKDKLKKKKKEPNRFIDSEFGLQATAIRSQVEFLEKALTITTAQMLIAERLKAEAVRRPLSYILGDLPRKARIVRDWLDQFLQEEGVDERS